MSLMATCLPATAGCSPAIEGGLDVPGEDLRQVVVAVELVLVVDAGEGGHVEPPCLWALTGANRKPLHRLHRTLTDFSEVLRENSLRQKMLLVPLPIRQPLFQRMFDLLSSFSFWYACIKEVPRCPRFSLLAK